MIVESKSHCREALSVIPQTHNSQHTHATDIQSNLKEELMSFNFSDWQDPRGLANFVCRDHVQKK